MIIDAAGQERIACDRDHVVMLNDWTDEHPARIYARLKKHSDYYNVAQPTLAAFLRDVDNEGMTQALAVRAMWNRMRMNQTDLSDVSACTYTCLMNGITLAGN